ncbi:MAG: DUF5654 family protein [bacterium]|nr:DUF5654 family protein [bacterium]MDZ4295743.1 DUF5654 family protein [Patescibacteria group bacterium]
MNGVRERLAAFRERGSAMEREVRTRTVGYIATALGLIAGLAWNDAVKSLIEYLFPLDQNTLVARFIYAAVVTAFVVVISIYLVRLAGGSEDRKEQ